MFGASNTLVTHTPSRIVKHIRIATYRFKRLSLGDYQAPTTRCCSTNTLPDFASSVMDGRLFNRPPARSRRHHASSSGRYGQGHRKPRHRKAAFASALISLSVILHPLLLRSLMSVTARLMLYAAKQSGRRNGALACKDAAPGKRRSDCRSWRASRHRSGTRSSASGNMQRRSHHAGEL